MHLTPHDAHRVCPHGTNRQSMHASTHILHVGAPSAAARGRLLLLANINGFAAHFPPINCPTGSLSSSSGSSQRKNPTLSSSKRAPSSILPIRNAFHVASSDSVKMVSGTFVRGHNQQACLMCLGGGGISTISLP